MKLPLAVVVVLAVTAGAVDGAQGPPLDGVGEILRQIERVVASGNAAAYLDLLAAPADRARALDFVATELPRGATRAVVQERDRVALASGYRVTVEVFTEFGPRARIATWRLDLLRAGSSEPDEGLRVLDQRLLSSVENLYRLSLDPTKQFDARDVKVTAEDFVLTLAQGSAFVVQTDQGITGVVLLGRGTLQFQPAPAIERGQVKVFCGSESLETRFDSAFVRLNPGDFDAHVTADRLTPRAVDPRDFRRADDVFRQDSGKSFTLDLGDLSPELWSLLPTPGDFVAEIRTRRFDALTYAKSSSEAEDISFFDRKRRHNIALYASQQKAAARAGQTDDDAEAGEYRVLEYNVDVEYSPERWWLDGRARLRLKVRSAGLNTLMLRLADPLVVHSIRSDELGRLIGIRVRDQNTIIVNLPAAMPRDSELALTIAYAGRLEPQSSDREAVQVGRGAETPELRSENMPPIPAEPRYLYSSRTFWYPQAPVSGYATGTLRVSVPPAFDCVASGDLAPGFPVLASAADTGPRKVYVFLAAQPLRYLAFLVSRFARTDTATIVFPPEPVGDDLDPPIAGVSYPSLRIAIEANPRQAAHGHELLEDAMDIARFFRSVIGDVPYPSFTVALIENDLPGGHSPAYFAALNQPLPTSPVVWNNDPAAFSNYPEFFIAHELAHQWWGQAVGWRTYHEQWLSEGFAQYFAALYAQHRRGDEVFAGLVRRLRRWAMDQSDQGPVSLGYRLGHVKDNSRVFRALVYNKGAAVLHMLRRLVGDEAFFRGLRRFYRTSRFEKAATSNLRLAMEAESGVPLDRFFDRWIYGTALPRLKFSYRVEPGEAGRDVVLHVEQLGEIFDVPLTVTILYADRSPVGVVVPVTERVVERRVRLTGTLRAVDINKDDGMLAEIVR